MPPRTLRGLVRATTIASEIVAALSGPPFRLLSVTPGPRYEVLEEEATWRRVLVELRTEEFSASYIAPEHAVAVLRELHRGRLTR